MGIGKGTRKGVGEMGIELDQEAGRRAKANGKQKAIENFAGWMFLSAVTFFWLVNFLPGASVQAAVVDRTVEVTTKEKNAGLARKELTDQAQSKAIEDMVLEVLGEERFNKNKATILAKVVKMAARLIPFSKMGNMDPLPDGGYHMSAFLKVNQDELEQVLIQNGLFYESDVQPLILPLVVWNDRTEDQSWSWWTSPAATSGSGPLLGGALALLSRLNGVLEGILRPQFLKAGFFVQRPQGLNFREGLPLSPGLSLGLTEIQAMATARSSQIALTGEVEILPGKNRSGTFELNLKMAVLHIPRNRRLAQVARKINTEVGPKNAVVPPKFREVLESAVSDLAGQTLEAWQKGTAQSNRYRIVLMGPIPLSVQESFPEAFKGKAHEIKSIYPRTLTSQGDSFEVLSVTPPRDLAKRVSTLEVNGGKLTLKEISDQELKYTLTLTSSDGASPRKDGTRRDGEGRRPNSEGDSEGTVEEPKNGE